MSGTQPKEVYTQSRPGRTRLNHVPLTTETLRAVYDFLSTTPPFNKWNLPDGEDIAFKVVRARRLFGWYDFKRGKHTVHISEACVGYTQSLIVTMAHEMIHVHEEYARACSRGAEHSAAFRKWAEEVCAVHGFDPRAF